VYLASNPRADQRNFHIFARHADGLGILTSALAANAVQTTINRMRMVFEFPFMLSESNQD